MNNLKYLGFSNFFSSQVDDDILKQLTIARVIEEHKGIYKIKGIDFEKLAKVSGRFQYLCESLSDYPTVGDFVLVRNNSIEGDHLIIERILDRKSLIKRQTAGTKWEEQAIAANVDKVFIVTSFNKDFNIRRIERYLVLLGTSHATPIIVINKSDLTTDKERYIKKLKTVSKEHQIVTTSAYTGDNLEAIINIINKGETIAFIGSSGVGKSTLINRLLDKNEIRTGEIKEDEDKGRHTTTTRSLHITSSGIIIIDTPGMREIGLTGDEEIIEDTFSDIEKLQSQCTYRNCTHLHEPGCAIQEAIAGGSLEEKRFLSYQKLRKERTKSKKMIGKEELRKRKKEWGKDIAKKIKQVKKSKAKYN